MVDVAVGSIGYYFDFVVKIINDCIQIVVLFCFFFCQNASIVILPYWRATDNVGANTKFLFMNKMWDLSLFIE